MSSESKTSARREFLVDRKMQLSVVMSMIGVLFALTSVYVVAVVANTSPDSGADSAAIRRLAFLTTGAYFVVVLVATLIVGVKVTHRIAGPARLIEHAVRALRRGDFSARLGLRQGDHLATLAAEVAGLRAEIEALEDHRRGQDTELMRLLQTGDLDAAQDRLNARLQGRLWDNDATNGLDEEPLSDGEYAA